LPTATPFQQAAQRAFQVVRANHPKTVDLLVNDRDRFLTFFDFQTERWRHLRTFNLIERIFDTVRLNLSLAEG
jgi:transposase-like protein